MHIVLSDNEYWSILIVGVWCIIFSLYVWLYDALIYYKDEEDEDTDDLMNNNYDDIANDLDMVDEEEEDASDKSP